MSNTLKNLLVILGVLTVGYAGYYLYSSRTSTVGAATTEVEYQAMLIRTQAFIQHSQDLNAIALDFSLFENPKFTSLQSYSLPLDTVTPGRTNPFAEATGGF